MRSSGNSPSSDARRRLELAFRAGNVNRVLAAAKPVQDLGELDLVDAAQICALLTLHDDPRASRAGARLAARITLALGLDLETLDVVVDLVAHVTDPSRLNELRGYCDRAEARSAG